LAVPLDEIPALPDQLRMEPESFTFACYCEVSRNYGQLDTRGCDSLGEKTVVGKIIPENMILSWYGGDNIITQKIRNSAEYISLDALNLTLFTDSAWSLYSLGEDFTGSANARGVLGACSLSLSPERTISLQDGRLGEVARVALYLADTYSLPMPLKTRERFIAIHKYSPPTAREHFRNKRGYKINRSWNSWVEERPIDKKSIHQKMTDKLDSLTYKIDNGTYR
jgi:hypothetical protein